MGYSACNNRRLLSNLTSTRNYGKTLDVPRYHFARFRLGKGPRKHQEPETRVNGLGALGHSFNGNAMYNIIDGNEEGIDHF